MADTKVPGLPRWVFGVATGLVVLAVVFYAWIGITRPAKASWWSMMGDTGAPFAALFNAGALLAALWAVHLQRQESHDAAESTRRQLDKMSEQVTEFARAAKAQQELVEWQRKLTEAQLTANQEAGMLRHSQMSNTVATLHGALATMTAARIDGTSRGIWQATGDAQLDTIKVHLEAEQERWRVLRDKLGLDRSAVDRSAAGEPQRTYQAKR